MELSENSIHIHCGDFSADSLRRSGLPGDVAAWFDPVLEGQVSDLPYEEFLAARAQYWLDEPGIPFDSFEAAWGARRKHDEVLEDCGGRDEVVLWFDACLFDQTILLHHLNWFSTRDLGSTRLSLISAGAHSSVAKFDGLGQLAPDDLAALADDRVAVTPQMLELGADGWAAYRSPDPTAIEAFLKRDLSLLPHLAAALHRHLERFPSAHNGLNRMQNVILEALAEPKSFGEIFAAVSAQEFPAFCGDTYVAAEIRRLAGAQCPALTVDSDISRTSLGQELLRGNGDWVELNGIDRWLGGCHLTGDRFWRWDAQSRRLIQGPQTV